MNKRGKYLLLMSVLILVIIGFTYALALGQEFRDDSLTNTTLIELIPEKCQVIENSDDVEADIEFNRDEFGNIVDNTYLNLVTKNVYEGAKASYRITAKNISSIPLSIDNYTINIEGNNDELEDSIYFSGRVMLYKNNGEYYDEIGTFSEVNITELADNLTNIMKYRKIDINQELILELEQEFGDIEELTSQDDNLSYRLMPIFIQYFPEDNN